MHTDNTRTQNAHRSHTTSTGRRPQWTARRTTRRAAFLLASSIVATAIVGTAIADAAPAAVPSADRWVATRLSMTADGTAADGDSFSPSLSGDGNHVAFVTAASNLGVPSRPDGTRAVVRDLRDDTMSDVGIGPDGGPLESTSEVDVNHDGSVVAMIAGAVQGHLFVRDRHAGVSIEAADTAPVQTPAISDSGDRIAYADVNRSTESSSERVRLFDATGGSGVAANTTLYEPRHYQESSGHVSMNTTGTRVALDVTEGDMYLETRVVDTTDPAAPTTVISISGVHLPALDGSGNRLAYVVGAFEQPQQIQIRDLMSGTEAIVADIDNGTVATAMELSADGSTLAYRAESDGAATLVVVDVATGATQTLASTGLADAFDLSADGRRIVFSSRDADLVAGDSGDGSDVFVAHRVSVTAPTWPDGAALTSTDIGNTFVALAWPAATDDLAVANYQVFVDGVIAAQLDGMTHGHVVRGLRAATMHRFEVFAVDADGAAGDPLALDAATTDVSSTPGTAALSLVAGPGGRVTLSWDADGDATEYTIERADADGKFVAVVTIDAADSSHADEGLAASTTYRYRVIAEPAGVIHTVESEVTTSAVRADAASWTGRLRVDGAIDLDLRGAPGWSGSFDVDHQSWYGDDGELLDEPRSLTTTVPATEDSTSPGHYVATFALADGISRVDAVRGIVGDGHGATASQAAANPPSVVRGALHVELTNADEIDVDGRVVVDSVAQRTFGDWTSWTLESVLAGDRPVTAYDANGGVMARVPSRVENGRHTTVELTPREIGHLAVRVTDEAGVVVAGARASIVSLPDRTPVGTVTADRAGVIRAPGSLHVGDEVELTITPPAHLALLPATVTQTAVPPDLGAIDVALPTSHTGILQGRVTFGGTIPAVGARVAVSQINDTRSASTVTDADGRYVLRTNEGPVSVAVSYHQDHPKDLGTIVLSGEPTTRDVDLAVPGLYRVVSKVYTRTVEDSDWTELPFSQISGSQHRLTYTFGASTYPLVSSETVVRGVAGDVITVCGDGREFGLGRDCETVTLGDAPVVPIELRMAATAGFRARLVDWTGMPPQDVTLTASISRWTGSAFQNVAYRQGTTAEISSPLPEPGRYRVTFSLWQPTANGNGASPFYVARDFDVVEGQVVDLGAVPFDRSAYLTRSDVTVNRSVLPVGGVVEVRAAIRPDTSGTRTEMSARVAIPAGATLVEGSATVDGTPAPVTMDGDTAVVEIGDRTFHAGVDTDAVIVRYRLTTDGVEPGNGFNAYVRVRSTFAGATTTEFVGAPSVSVAGITMVGPEHSTTAAVTIRGLAPAGHEVIVTENRQEIGRTTATPGGRWTLHTRLPNRGLSAEHVLFASVTMDRDDGTPVTVGSTPTSIVVDPRLPELVDVSFLQLTHGYASSVISIDPRTSAGNVPFVFRGDPGQLQVETTFAGRGSITDLAVSVGLAEGQTFALGGNRYRTHVSTRNTELGAITATYEKVPDMATLDDIPVYTESEVREMLPQALADAPPPVITEQHDPAANIRSARFMSNAADGTGLIDGTISVTHGLLYNPSAADLELSTQLGVPAYGLTYEFIDGDPAVIKGSIMVPTSALGEPGPSSGLYAGAVLTSFQLAFTRATTLDSVFGSATAGGKYQRLGEIAEWMNANCNASSQSQLQPVLDKLGKKLLYSEGLKIGLLVVGAATGVGTFGLSTVGFWAITNFLDKFIDYELTKEIDRFQTYAERTCDDRNEDIFADWPEDKRPDPNYRPWRAPDGRLADPVWIHDPSGYVFEGVPSNRIEGVTATLTASDSPTGPFAVWDAEWYGQSNPLTTDGLGAYGWDVPEGFWQVLYTADGYETSRSAVLEVLPPHFDVNVPMTRTTPPAVAAATASSSSAGSGVTVEFDNYMRLDATDHIAVSDANGEPVDGAVEAIDAEDGPAGRFASTFRFTPTDDLVAGDRLLVSVAAMASDHAGRPMLDDFSTSVELTAEDEEPPTVTATFDRPAGAAGWHDRPVTVTLHADDDLSGVAEIRWTAEGAQPGDGTDVDGDAEVVIAADGETTLAFHAVDRVGNTSAEQTLRVRLDGGVPSVSVASPIDGVQVAQNAVLVADFSCTDGGSGVERCTARLADGGDVVDGAALRTSVVGTQTLEVTAVDRAGNTSTTSVGYQVMAPPASASALQLIDEEFALIRSFRLPVIRELALNVPLVLAKAFVVTGSKKGACAALDGFGVQVTLLKSLKLLTASQAKQLQTGATKIDVALRC